jgi:spermidine synthase
VGSLAGSTLDRFTEYSAHEGLGLILETKRKLHEEKSEYQTIEVYETTKFGNLLTLDGLVMLTGRDNFIYHEMMVHPALFTHPDPRRILIIGGGDCGCLHEALKHPVERVDMVELDERVTRVSEQYFPELCASNHDPRASIYFLDGIKWVKDAKEGSYDVIIVDSTDPIGQAARLFQAPFYTECRRALSDQGILVVQSESPLLNRELIKSIQQEMDTAGFPEIATIHYPQCTYPSGWWSSTLASAAMLGEFRSQNMGNRIATRYYNEDIHAAAFALPVFLQEALA